MAPSDQRQRDLLDQMSVADLRARLSSLTDAGGPYAYQVVALDQRTSWDADQLALQRQINEKAATLGDAGIDPEVVPADNDLAGLSWQQIADGVGKMDPGFVWDVAQAWVSMGDQLDELVGALNGMLTKTLSSAWSGDAADAATAAVSGFTGVSTALARSVSLTGLKMKFAQRGLDETKRFIQPLVDAPPGSSAGIIPAPSEQQQASRAQQENLASAREILQVVYAPAIRGGDQGVPTLPSVTGWASHGAPAVVGGGVGSEPSGGEAHITSTAGPGPSTADGRPQSTTGSGAAPAAAHALPTFPAGASQAAPGQQAVEAVDGDPAATHAAAAVATPDAGFDGASIPEAGPDVGGGGSSADPGREYLAAPPADPAVGGHGASAGASAATAARAGSSGMPGAASAAPIRGREDKDHRSPDYLRGTHYVQQWLDESKGLPVGGVIGDWPQPAPESSATPPGESGKSEGEYR